MASPDSPGTLAWHSYSLSLCSNIAGLLMTMGLSEAAWALLLEASRDSGGLIVRLTAPGGGAFLKSNGKVFGNGTAVEQAKWDGAIQQLLRLRLLEPGGGRVYCITQGGYQAADRIQHG